MYEFGDVCLAMTVASDCFAMHGPINGVEDTICPIVLRLEVGNQRRVTFGISDMKSIPVCDCTVTEMKVGVGVWEHVASELG